jgi:hypothetical protein
LRLERKQDLFSFRTHSESGLTIVESGVAAMVIAIAIGSIFALNSACLRLARNAKDSAVAMLSNQERVEQMRSCNWSEITDENYMSQSVMNAPTQTGAALGNATEIIRVTQNGFIPTGSTASYFEITRTPTTTSITAENNPDTVINSRMPKVDVTLNWNTLFGTTEQTTNMSILRCFMNPRSFCSSVFFTIFLIVKATENQNVTNSSTS